MAQGAIMSQTPDLSKYLKNDGTDSMTGNLNMNNNKITNVTNGSNSKDAVNYSQLQTKLSTSGGTMTGPINMGNNKITNVANGTANTDVANVGQMNTKLSLSGGTMSGQISMSNNKITNLANGVSSTDAINLGQFQSMMSNLLPVYYFKDSTSPSYLYWTGATAYTEYTTSRPNECVDRNHADLAKYINSIYNPSGTSRGVLFTYGNYSVSKQLILVTFTIKFNLNGEIIWIEFSRSPELLILQSYEVF